MIRCPRSPFVLSAIALGAVLSVLALPSAASANSPSALTADTYSSGPSTATVEGTVNPGGEDTHYQVQYGPASSDWCTSGGASGSPTDTTALTDVGFTDYSNYPVSVDLTTDLTEGTDYCAQLIAMNTSGGSDGGPVTWTQGAPFADTFDASSTGQTAATVDGDVNAAGQSTSYVVKYDLESSEWCSTDGASGVPADATTPQMLPDTDGTFHDVSIGLSGLAASVSYCAEVVATNGTGSSPIDDGAQVFWTQPTPPPPPPLPTLSVDVSGSGTVTSSPPAIDCGAGASTCTADIPLGTQVTLTATPATGSIFVTWLDAPGSCTAGVLTCTFTLTRMSLIEARFNTPRAEPHTLTVSRAGSGSGNVASNPSGIDCGLSCSNSFPAAAQITLSATADPDATFAGWSGGGCSGTGTCIVTLSTDTTVTATFTENPSKPNPAKCVVPKVKGKSLSAAKKAIKSHHCSVGKIAKVKSTTKNRGRVISQSPKPGKHLRRGSKVALKVGK